MTMLNKNDVANKSKKVLTQDKPQSSFLLSYFHCPNCNTRLNPSDMKDFVCPSCKAELPNINSIYRAKTEKVWTLVPKEKKEKVKGEQGAQPKKKKEKVVEKLLPGVEVGTFVFFGKASKEYMVIDIGEGKYYGLRIMAKSNCDGNDYVQSAYRDKVVILDKPATVIMPSQIKRTKARLAMHVVQSIVDKHNRCLDNKKYRSSRNSNEKRDQKGDGLYVGNAWEGLSMTAQHIKVFRG